MKITKQTLSNLPPTVSIASRLSPEERRLRAAVIERMVATAGPVTLADLGKPLGWTTTDTDSVAQALVKKKVVVVNEAHEVKYAYPVSAVPSGHQVALADGRMLYAMCAMDALGCFFHFRQAITIHSSCHDCGRPIKIEIPRENVILAEPASVHVLHMDLDQYDDWASQI